MGAGLGPVGETMINRTIRSFACALVFSTSVLSCSDDVRESHVNTTPSAAPGSGGAGGGVAEPGATQVEDVVEAALSCLGLTASRALSSLSLAEAERACRGARQCEALIRWSTDAELCWILAAVTGNQANADTAQATCEKQYSDCIAAPDVELKE